MLPQCATSVMSPTAAPWPGLDVACHSPFSALQSSASGVLAQPLVMQSNNQSLLWTLFPPKQGFLLINLELNSHYFIYFWNSACLFTAYSVMFITLPDI